MPIRIIIFEDNDKLRESLAYLLKSQPEYEMAGDYNNCNDAATIARVYKPDVVLMDIDMPAVNGVQAVKRIRKINTQLPVIMLTVFDDNENIFKAICAGASGYILKRYATEEIPAAIRDVLTGGAPMTGSVARKVLLMVPQAKTNEDEQEKCNLSSRETAILQFLVNGYSYKMIASEMKISIDTVRFHIKKIYDKLHVHSATEAVSRALKDKLVSLFFFT